MLSVVGFLFFVIVASLCVIVARSIIGSVVTITSVLAFPYLLVCIFQMVVAVVFGYIDVPCMNYWVILSVFLLVTLLFDVSFHVFVYKRMGLQAVEHVKDTRSIFKVFVLLFVAYVLYDTYNQIVNIDITLLLQEDFQEEYSDSASGGLISRMALILFGTYFFVFQNKIWGFFIGILCFAPNFIVNTKGIILLPIVAIVILMLYFKKLKHPIYLLLAIGLAGPLIFFVSYFFEYSIYDTDVISDTSMYRYVGEKLITYLVAGVQEFNCNIASAAEAKFEGLDNVTLSPFYNFLHKFGMAEYVENVNPVLGYIGKLPIYGDMYSNVNTYIGTLYLFSGLVGGILLHIFWMLLTMAIKVTAELSGSPFFLALYSLYLSGFALGWFEFYFLHTFWIYLIAIAVVVDLLFVRRRRPVVEELADEEVIPNSVSKTAETKSMHKNFLSYSVALCTYNGAQYVREQLMSILDQTVRPSQVVVSDDGSLDGTKEIVESILGASGIDYSVVDNSLSHGVTGNFQNAISLCKYSIVFTSDQDDVWKSTKAEEILNVFDNNAKALLVFSDGELVDQNMVSLNCSVWTSLGITENIVKSDDMFHMLLKRCLVTGAAMAFKKSLFDEIRTIPKEWLHDGWLAWLAVSKDGLMVCDQKLFYYRQHSNNVVGMLPLNSYSDRVRRYLNNFKKMKEWRWIRYKRYEALYNEIADRFTESQKNDIRECVSFWKSLYESDDKNFFQRLKVIYRLYKKGFYYKYYTGAKGMLRDVVLAFV